MERTLHHKSQGLEPRGDGETMPKETIKPDCRRATAAPPSARGHASRRARGMAARIQGRPFTPPLADNRVGTRGTRVGRKSFYAGEEPKEPTEEEEAELRRSHR